MQKITPFLWFNDQAEEAVHFYTSIFKNSKITDIARYGKDTPGVEGTVMTVAFQLEGQDFMALNGGPVYQFSPAISFLVSCETQTEVDWLWDSLSAGGQVEQCGWLIDRYGVSWQIVPRILGEMLQDKNAQKSQKVMQALLQMKKLDIKILKQAYKEG
jgi:predicted 3-demethylubiquinone-9 3-methyltransferase (glyoxalase superfamily)